MVLLGSRAGLVVIVVGGGSGRQLALLAQTHTASRARRRTDYMTALEMATKSGELTDL